MTLTLPTRLGRYELLVSLGSGGMATVYLARHVGPAGYARHVALKLLHPHMRDDPQAVLGFIREARLASELRHPNIVQVLDVDDLPQGLFMVMEQIEGGSLARLARGQFRVPLPISLRLLTDALTGLHHAHQHRDSEGRSLQVVHRDFTPQNILVGVDGVAKLTDFGIAKMLGSGERTTTGVVKGKVSYMAPEQAEGRLVDARTDIWAAGVVAWELIAKRRLYTDDNDVSILLKIVRERPPRLKTVRPDISTALDEAVACALEPNPSRRYATADAFRNALLSAFEIADLDETSAYVRNAFGEELTSRKQAVSNSIAKADAISNPVTISEKLTATAARRRSKARAILVVTGAIAMLGGAAATLAMTRSTPTKTEESKTGDEPSEPSPPVMVSVSSVDVPRSNEPTPAVETPAAKPSGGANAKTRTKNPPIKSTGSAPGKPPASANLPPLLNSPYDHH